MPSPRRLFRLLPSVLVLLATVALLLVGCGCDGDEATDADAAGTSGGSESAEPVTLTVGLFGTFGYEEAGLYDEYKELHPGRHDRVRVDVEQEQLLPGAADPAGRRLRPRRHPGHRGRPASPTSRKPGRQVGRPAPTTAAADELETLLRLEVGRGHAPRTARSSASGPTSARRRSATARTCFEQAGLPDRPRELGRAVEHLGRLPRRWASSTWPTAPGRQRLDRQRRRPLQRDHLHRARDLLRRGRQADLRRRNPAVQGRLRHCRHGGRPRG